MSQPVTLADIYKLFETLHASLEESRAEFDRRTAEFDRRSAEFDRRSAEAKTQYERQIAEARAEYERQAAERERSMKELERTVAQTSREVANLTTRWGRFVEELVEPAVVALFQSKGIAIEQTFSRARQRRQGVAMEIDILGIDGTDAVAVECKSRLSRDDVDEFIEKLGRFKVAFPQYANYRVFGAVAGIEIDEGVDRYASRQGLFVIRPAGDTVAIVNDDNFQPQTW